MPDLQLCSAGKPGAIAQVRQVLAGLAVLLGSALLQSCQTARNPQGFEGSIAFDPSPDQVSITVGKDKYQTLTKGPYDFRDLPAFDRAFVSLDDRLVPVVRGPVRSPSAFWDWVVMPGYVTPDNQQPGRRRAFIPVALQPTGWSCTFAGTISFLIPIVGDLSEAALDIAQETCPDIQIDASGRFPVRIASHAIKGGGTVAAAFENELASRLPTVPISRIAASHPGIDPNAFGSPEELDPNGLTLFGVVIDGKHFASGCMTRKGPFPYCDELPMPSFSVAKSISGGLAMMRLEQLVPGAARAPIADLVPQCAAEGSWGGITIEDALDMATGRFVTAERMIDDETEISWLVHETQDYDKLINFACTRYPSKAEPGQVWVYHTSDTFLAGVAMDALWKRHSKRADADLFTDVLVNDVFRALRLSPEIAATRRTAGSAQLPYSGAGLTLIRDDLAKLGRYLAEGSGIADGRPIARRERLAAALQRDPLLPGLQIDARERYNDSFWAMDIGKAIGCEEPVWAAYMSGYGGVTLAVLPNRTAYYYVSDGEQYDAWNRAMRELHKLRPMC